MEFTKQENKYKGIGFHESYTTNFSCNKKCCQLYINRYDGPEWKPFEEYFKNKIYKPEFNEFKIKKAGTFIYDPYAQKILIVQSRGKYWGSPKGSLDDNETVKECAIRETKEETGIDLEEIQLKLFTCVKNKCIYYDYETKEFTPTVQNHIANNDVNGIGWIKLECLRSLIHERRIVINQHFRILIKRKYNIDLIH
jgi:ADP-ribose pyrophosphatase YjhB (NUDIX family)